jgi:RHS repeat-associated protein
VTYQYDAFDRLQAIAYPQGTLALSYIAATGQVLSKTSAGGESVTYGYDGFLPTSTTWSGPVAGLVSQGFDNNFRMTSQAINSGTSLAFGYDSDGLLTGAGALTLTLDPNNGRVTGTTLGSISDTYGYDVNGLFASYAATYGGTLLYSESVQRDADHRITQKTEVIGTTQHVWGYTYDVNGRLTNVTEDGNFASHYAYDADDNRTTYTNTGGTVNPTYDAQDRLLTYGSNSYQYTADGELTTKTGSAGMTQYAYDALGNLLSVSLPGGEDITYVVDGENRRVGKQVGGSLTTGFLYKDALNVVVQLDGSGNVVSRFVFGSKPNVPDYFTSSSGTFRILSDHLGSPRLLVNASTGAVLEEIDYDEFGNVTSDTAPGTIPFGFAGGLYDSQTGLVRFGARDYDASLGRWTSKDPIRFGGGSLNLYGYVVNDPVDITDLPGTGPACNSASAGCEPLPEGTMGGCECRCNAAKICNLENCGYQVTCVNGVCRADPNSGGNVACAQNGQRAWNTCVQGCRGNSCTP